jgi:hypothetical protein
LGYRFPVVTMITVGHDESPWGLRIPKKNTRDPPLPRSLLARREH